MTRKKIGLLLAFLLLALVASWGAYTVYERSQRITSSNELQVMVAVDSRQLHSENAKNILAGYQSVLEEEGVASQQVDIYELVKLDAAAVAKNTPAILFPDRAALYLPDETVSWLHAYLEHGGTAAVVYDVGTQNKKDKYLDESVLTSLLGFNYCTFKEDRENAFHVGKFKFASSDTRDFWDIPEGKTDDEMRLSGYSFGALDLPVRSINDIRDLSGEDIYAQVVAPDGTEMPGLIHKSIGSGHLFYVNLPLGALKIDSDDLMLRSFLRTILFKFAQMPHVMNVAQGQGGIILNWHVDSAEELDVLPELFEEGFLHENIPMSFHVTAGDYLNEPGDGEGFNAEGARGHAILEKLKDYGRVGSHGGWAHNWFAKNLFDGNFSEDEMRHYIKINNDAVEAVTGIPVTEYAAPDGVYPQPVSTKELEDMGIIAYYYTGDSGSFMNRTFYNGKMVSEQTIAVPIMPFGDYASLEEMHHLGNLSPEQVMDWMQSLVSYSNENRTIRMFYSHPYDLQEYPGMVIDFLDWLDEAQEDGEIRVLTMTDAVSFFKRFLKTEYSFHRTAAGMHVQLKNPEGLKDITVAVPKKGLGEFTQEGLDIDDDDDQYYYITVTNNDENEMAFDIPAV